MTDLIIFSDVHKVIVLEFIHPCVSPIGSPIFVGICNCV